MYSLSLPYSFLPSVSDYYQVDVTRHQRVTNGTMPTQVYPVFSTTDKSQRHVLSFRLRFITYHVTSAPFLYLHHRHCQSQNITFIRLIYPSPQDLPLKT